MTTGVFFVAASGRFWRTPIHAAARGKPRAVNNLAIAALIATCAAGRNLVDQQAARAAITEVI
jgi:hypothetical protein